MLWCAVTTVHKQTEGVGDTVKRGVILVRRSFYFVLSFAQSDRQSR